MSEARRSQPWVRYMERAGIPPLPPEEQMRLVRRWHDERDTQARDRLILSHLRAIVKPAAKYGGPKHDMEDAIQDATVGLLMALDRFDTSKSGSFSNYAKWWVLSRVLLGATTRYTMGRSVSTRAYSAERRLWENADHDVTQQEIIEEAGMSMAAGAAYLPVVSLNEMLPDGGHEHIEFVVDETTAEPDPPILSAAQERRLVDDVEALTPARLHTLTRRYGLDGNPPLEQGPLAKRWGVTRQMISLREMLSLRALVKKASARLTT